MIRSMTAFASIDSNESFGRLAWEIRSVNHRYLEIGMRLPEEIRSIEGELREIAGRHVNRGKLDATLRFQPSGEFSGQSIGLNRGLLDSLLDIHQQLASDAGQDQPPDLLTLMRWPGVVEEQSGDLSEVYTVAMQLFDQALGKLVAMRRREGEKLAAMVTERLTGVEHWVGQARDWLPEILHQQKQKILDKINQLDQPLDDGRLEQEVTLLAQKIDVAEELDRLQVHVDETRRVLGLTEPVGRRLDFLMQEFNRESNTLSSKSADSRTTQAGVELKVLVEQMREQVQNVE